MFAQIKLYLYGALAAALLGFGIYYTVHERHIGEQKIEARDAKIEAQRTALATAAAALNAAAEALAQKKSDQIGEKLEETVTAPVVNPPHLLCYRAAPASGGLPKASGDQPGDHGASDQRAEAPVDIGPPVVTVGRDADAQINALIDEVQVLTDEMNGKSK